MANAEQLITITLDLSFIPLSAFLLHKMKPATNKKRTIWLVGLLAMILLFVSFNLLRTSSKWLMELTIYSLGFYIDYAVYTTFCLIGIFCLCAYYGLSLRIRSVVSISSVALLGILRTCTDVFVHLLTPDHYSTIGESFLRLLIFLIVSLMIISLLLFSFKGTAPTLLDGKTLLASVFLSILLIGFNAWFSFVVSMYTLSVEKQLVITVLVLIFIGCIYYFYRALENYYQQNLQIQRENLAYQGELRYLQGIKENQETIQEVRHDLKNQYLILAGLLTNPTKESIQEALKYIRVSQNKIQQREVFYTYDFVLNYLLNEKYRYAQDLDVKLTLNILIPKELKLKADLLAVVIGNLLDNAIAAASRITNDQERSVDFSIRSFNQNITIEVRNYFETDEEQTRADRYHNGFGLKNIRKAVAEVHGLYQQETHGNQYQTTIIFLNAY